MQVMKKRDIPTVTAAFTAWLYQTDEFTWVNTMIASVKNAITGTYHAIKPQHLPQYLCEFCYRFNRRFHL